MRFLFAGAVVFFASIPAFAEDDMATRIAAAVQGATSAAEAVEALNKTGLLDDERSADAVIYTLKTAASLQNMSINPDAIARALESGKVDMGGDGGSGGEGGIG